MKYNYIEQNCLVPIYTRGGGGGGGGGWGGGGGRGPEGAIAPLTPLKLS